MNEYLFDVKLFAVIRVKANTEAEARAMLIATLDAATCNAGAWPNGDPVVFEASLDEPANDALIEINAVQ